MSAIAVLRSLGFAAVFYVAVLLGRLTVMDGTSLSLVWPAAGVAVVWFAVQRRVGTLGLDLVLLSAITFVVNVVTGASAALAGAFVVANIAQVLTFGALFRRWCPQVWGAGGREPLTGVAQLMRLVCAAVVGAGAGAFIGPAAVWASTGTWSWLAALVWMTRNTASILLIAGTAFRVGCLLGARQARRADQAAGSARSGASAVVVPPMAWPQGWRLVELTAAMACSVVAYGLVFGVFDGMPLTFLLVALTAWVAMRFDTTIVLVHDLVVGVVAVMFTLNGHGSFGHISDDGTRAVLVQLYTLVLAGLGLAIALGRDERDLLLARMVASTAASERLAVEAAEQRALAVEQRQAAEAAMAEAEARGELTLAVLETVDVGIVVAGPDGRLVMFNRTAHDWHGRDADGSLDLVEYAQAYDLYEADGVTPLAPVDVPLHRIMHGGRLDGAEIVIAPAGREPITVSCSGRRMSRADGSPLGAVVAMSDVTAARRELELAAHVQASLLPAQTPDVPGYELATAFMPAGSVAGDFYDWQATPGGVCLTLADVMGKGTGAAILAATLRSALQEHDPTDDVDVVLHRTETRLEPDLQRTGAFITATRVSLDAPSGRITYTDAGHGLTMIVRADGTTARLTSQGPPLGLATGARRTSARETLHPGDTLVAFSDGVLDTLGGRIDDLAALRRLVHASPSAQHAVDRIVDLARQTSPLPDDVTVIALRRHVRGTA